MLVNMHDKWLVSGLRTNETFITSGFGLWMINGRPTAFPLMSFARRCVTLLLGDDIRETHAKAAERTVRCVCLESLNFGVGVERWSYT
jgi:hypothetical protein